MQAFDLLVGCGCGVAEKERKTNRNPAFLQASDPLVGCGKDFEAFGFVDCDVLNYEILVLRLRLGSDLKQLVVVTVKPRGLRLFAVKHLA